MCGKLVVSVILLPMLVHSILGCCWHHAHCDGQFRCVQLTPAPHTCHHHRHHNDYHSEHRNPVAPSPGDHDKSCNDVRCVYLVAEPVQNASALELQEPVATLDNRGGLILNATVSAPVRRQQGKKVPLPSEHCALTQVWVV